MEGFLSKKYRLIRLLNEYEGLLFSVEMPFKTEVEITTVYLDSVPFSVILHNEGVDINAKLEAKGINYIDVDLDIKMTSLLDIVVLAANHIKSDLRTVIDIDIDLITALALHLKTSLKEQLLIDIKLRQPTALAWLSELGFKTNIDVEMNYSQVIALLVNMAKEVIIGVEADFIGSKPLKTTLSELVNVSSGLRTIDSPSSFGVGVQGVFNFNFNLESLIPTTIGVMVEVLGALATALILADAVALKSSLGETIKIVSSISYGRENRLNDLNNKSLALLDVKSLQELYFEII